MKTVMSCLVLIGLVGAQSAWAAEPAYVYDPAKHADLIKKRCQQYTDQMDTIKRRLKLGYKPWEKEKLDKKMVDLQSMYDRECQSLKMSAETKK